MRHFVWMLQSNARTPSKPRATFEQHNFRHQRSSFGGSHLAHIQLAPCGVYFENHKPSELLDHDIFKVRQKVWPGVVLMGGHKSEELRGTRAAEAMLDGSKRICVQNSPPRPQMDGFNQFRKTRSETVADVDEATVRLPGSCETSAAASK